MAKSKEQIINEYNDEQIKDHRSGCGTLIFFIIILAIAGIALLGDSDSSSPNVSVQSCWDTPLGRMCN